MHSLFFLRALHVYSRVHGQHGQHDGGHAMVRIMVATCMLAQHHTTWRAGKKGGANVEIVENCGANVGNVEWQMYESSMIVLWFHCLLPLRCSCDARAHAACCCLSPVAATPLLFAPIEAYLFQQYGSDD